MCFSSFLIGIWIVKIVVLLLSYFIHFYKHELLF